MTNYYVDPLTGDSADAGTSPGTAKESLADFDDFALDAGDTIFLIAKDSSPVTDSLTDRVKWDTRSGTSSNPITITTYSENTTAYQLDWSAGSGNQNDGIVISNSDYFVVEADRLSKVDAGGLALLGIDDNAIIAENFSSTEHGWHRFENLWVEDYGNDTPTREGNGIWLKLNTVDCEVINCRFRDGSAYRDSDGVYVGGNSSLQSGGHYFERVVCEYNADDGFDFYRADRDNPNTLVDCVARYNGRDKATWDSGNEDGTSGNWGDGNGFKMGGDSGGNNVLVRCVSYWNRGRNQGGDGDPNGDGFDDNGWDGNFYIQCTAHANEKYGFQCSGGDTLLINDVAYANGTDAVIGARSDINNSWDSGITVTDSDFVSVDPVDYGSGYLVPASGSVLEDAGVVLDGYTVDTDSYTGADSFTIDLSTVGVEPITESYEGSSPDLGRYEVGAGSGGAGDGSYTEVIVNEQSQLDSNNEIVYTLSGGENFAQKFFGTDGVLFDVRLEDPDATNPISEASVIIDPSGGGNVIENVGFDGPQQDKFIVRQPSIPSGTTDTVRHCYWSSYRDSSRTASNDGFGGGALADVNNHAGTLRFENCNIQGFGNNAVYASPPLKAGSPGGITEFYDCYFKNCTTSGYRFGGEGLVDNCIYVLDDPNRTRQNYPSTGGWACRGVWYRHQSGGTVRNSDFSMAGGDVVAAIQTLKNSDSPNPSQTASEPLRIEDCEIDSPIKFDIDSRMPIEVYEDGSQIAPENISTNPRTTPQAGTPTTPLEAATGTSSAGGSTGTGSTIDVTQNGVTFNSVGDALSNASAIVDLFETDASAGDTINFDGAPGDTVWVDTDDADLARMVDLNGSNIPDNLTVTGPTDQDGEPGITIKAVDDASVGFYMFELSVRDGMTLDIEHLAFDGNDRNNGNCAIPWIHRDGEANNITFTNCEFINGGDVSWRELDGTGAACQHCTFRDSTDNHAAAVTHRNVSGTVYATTFEQCHFKDCNGPGGAYGLNSSPGRVIARDCVVTNCRQGFKIGTDPSTSASYDTEHIRCRIDNPTDFGIFILADGTVHDATVTFEDLIIDNPGDEGILTGGSTDNDELISVASNSTLLISSATDNGMQLRGNSQIETLSGAEIEICDSGQWAVNYDSDKNSTIDDLNASGNANGATDDSDGAGTLTVGSLTSSSCPSDISGVPTASEVGVGTVASSGGGSGGTSSGAGVGTNNAAGAGLNNSAGAGI